MAKKDKKEIPVINFDDIPASESKYLHLDAVIYEDGTTSLKGLGKEPRFHEEIRRGENGEIVAYVMKRNKNTSKTDIK